MRFPEMHAQRTHIVVLKLCCNNNIVYFTRSQYSRMLCRCPVLAITEVSVTRRGSDFIWWNRLDLDQNRLEVDLKSTFRKKCDLRWLWINKPTSEKKLPVPSKVHFIKINQTRKSTTVSSWHFYNFSCSDTNKEKKSNAEISTKIFTRKGSYSL